MTRFLLIVAVILVGGMGYLAVRYGKEAYKLLPMNDAPSIELESELTADSDFEDWQEFTPAQKNFKVLMPETPQHVSNKVVDPKTKETRIDDVYLSEKKNGHVFMIHMTHYPDGIKSVSEEDDLLKTAMNDMLVSNPENKLMASQISDHKGQRSLDFVIENNAFYYNVREVLYGNVLVTLSSISRKPMHNLKEFQFFINSFEFFHHDVMEK